jgi:hypothetical protein
MEDDMKAEEINTLDDAERFCEGCLNDFELGISTKSETMKELARYTGRLNELFLGECEKENKG